MQALRKIQNHSASTVTKTPCSFLEPNVHYTR